MFAWSFSFGCVDFSRPAPRYAAASRPATTQRAMFMGLFSLAVTALQVGYLLCLTPSCGTVRGEDKKAHECACGGVVGVTARAAAGRRLLRRCRDLADQEPARPDRRQVEPAGPRH